MATHSPVQPAPKAARELCVRATRLSGLVIVIRRKTKPPLNRRLHFRIILSALTAISSRLCLSHAYQGDTHPLPTNSPL